MTQWIYLAIGSVAGGFSRYSLGGLVQEKFGANFPYGTLVINLTGCLLIGFFDSLAEDKFLLGPSERILLMTGFCGAYTTFSTFILETSNLIKGGEIGRGLLNILLSVGLGLVVFWIGAFLGDAL